MRLLPSQTVKFKTPKQLIFFVAKNDGFVTFGGCFYLLIFLSLTLDKKI